MESYQTAGIIVSIIGIILGMVVAMFIPQLGAMMFVINIITLILSAAVKTHTKGLGITLIVLGLLGNVFLLIPAIMALRHKPKKYELTK